MAEKKIARPDMPIEDAEQALIGQSDEEWTDSLLDESGLDPDNLPVVEEPSMSLDSSSEENRGQQSGRRQVGLSSGSQDNEPIGEINGKVVPPMDMNKDLSLEVIEDQEESEGAYIPLTDEAAQKRRGTRAGTVKTAASDNADEAEAARQARMAGDKTAGLKVDEEKPEDVTEESLDLRPVTPEPEETTEENTPSDANYAPVGEQVEKPKEYDTTEKAEVQRPSRALLMMDAEDEQLDIALGLKQPPTVEEPEENEREEGQFQDDPPPMPVLQVDEEDPKSLDPLPVKDEVQADVLHFDTKKIDFHKEGVGRRNGQDWSHALAEYHQVRTPGERMPFDSDVGWFLRNHPHVSTYTIPASVGIGRHLGLNVGGELVQAEFYRDVKYGDAGRTYCMGFAVSENREKIMIVRINEELL